MSEFRTFSGKTVDEAMEEACRHFAAAREKLEVEILSGGSSGIFGLVGKKKAQVRARLREEVNLLQDMTDAGNREETKKADRPPRQPKPARQPAPAKAEKPAEITPEPVAAAPEPAPQSAPEIPDPVAPEVNDDDALTEEAYDAYADDEEDRDFAEAAEEQEAPRRSGRAPREDRKPAAPETPPEPLTPELEAIVREVVGKMLEGILGEIPEFEISGHSERVSVLILDEENSGLLIGREGQTLSSIQYLVNRIVIRRHGSPVKVQINTGAYRERQDDNLRKMAIFLADKAKTLGRPQSTKPLSSYHRRVVHLALQEDEAISTRSKGEGPLKRVLIVPRGARGNGGNGGNGSEAQNGRQEGR
ncbi:RNA-binding cell elongation regulator Jag/EloR [Solidesulfovibrio alcoholivorans]|uniref:RNA-binding cell elongation regulator Jag/EloR n=1 Tax=Solidesulfovibrio alcoholivorans TaxID=81406 RepID=UPI0006936727|nr:RNA-binding cell elongation regulator Jag/EloR [Solidesulfovibrio alcoholivorans]